MHLKIGIKQIQLERHLQAAQLLQFLILRKQSQRRVIHTIGQRIKVMRDAEQGMAQCIAMHRRNLLRIRGKLAQRGCQFGAKYRHAVQADHLQHAQQTLQFGARRFQCHHIGTRVH